MNAQFVLIFFWFVVMLKGEALHCSYCYSNESWEECHSKTGKLICEDDAPVCYKAHRVEMKNDEEIHHYQKGCGPKWFCTGEECKEHGQWCEVHCCNTDACNESMSFYANYMTCIMLALLTTVHLL